jgi:hypothetical protein
MNHGNRPCGARGGAQPAADTFFSTYNSPLTIDFYGIHVAPVDAGKAGVTGIIVFFGIVVRHCHHSRVIVFGDKPQDPAAVAAAVSYKSLGTHLIRRAVNQAFLFGFLKYVLRFLLGNLPPESILDIEIGCWPKLHACLH